MLNTHDYLNAMCQNHNTPLYNIPKSIYSFQELTTTGRMFYIAVTMLYSGTM